MTGAATHRPAGSGTRPAAVGTGQVPGAGVDAERGSAGPARAPRDAVRPAVQLGSGLGRVVRGYLWAGLGALRARWLRSLQLRVVTATLIISGLVVTVLGFFLTQQITAAVLQAEVTRASNLTAEGLFSAESEPWVTSSPDSRVSGQIMSLVAQLQARTSSSGGDYGIEIVPASSRVAYSAYTEGATEGISALPPGLITAVDDLQAQGLSKLSYTFTKLDYYSRGNVPGLAFGAPLGNYYQLYYFFPLTQEQDSLVSVQRTMLLVGLALVVLLAAIAWLVTRWVVVPVREAARGARRLSTGRLDERMEVRGADELAALATSFNEMAASLQEKMHELEDLSQVQRQFVSDVSHELRTPLTTIRIAADVLFASRTHLGAAASRSAEVLQSQLERFESLLIDLLEISRYDANVATLDAEPADVCDLVRNAADVAQQLAERKGAKIEFRLPAAPCIAEVDRRRVERILRNLLVNAVEHGESRDTLVTVAADSGAVAVAVRDYGCGLEPGEEHLVFDRFWRADPARARTTGGTGLGLAIALEDARLHGGWLEAWGQVGRGSSFRLTLPRVGGAELEGSPLPLVPDDAELADGTRGLPELTAGDDLSAATTAAADTGARQHG